MKGLPERIRSLPPFPGPIDARRLSADGCDVLFASYASGQVIAPHTHPTENVGVVLSGEMHLGTERGVEVFAPGQWYQLAPNERHHARFEIDTTILELWFEPGSPHPRKDSH